MDVFKEAEQLRQVPMFSKLNTSKLKLLAFTSEAVKFRDRELLFEVGEPSDSAYVILEGEVEILVQTDSGEMMPVLTRGRNELIGEMAVLSNAPRSATLRARGSVRVLKIVNEVFVKLVTENSQVAFDVMKQLSDKLSESHKQVEDLERQLQRQ